MGKPITKDNSFNGIINLSRKVVYTIGKETYENQEDANKRAVQIIKICLINLLGVWSLNHEEFDNFAQLIKEKGIIEYESSVFKQKCVLTYIENKDSHKNKIVARFDKYQLYINKASKKRVEYNIDIIEEEND